VILIDANLLLYAKFSDLPQHPRARRWLEDQLDSLGRVGIPWQSSLAFLRLATNPRLFAQPLTSGAAWRQIAEWLDHPRVWIPEPTDSHPMVLGELLIGANATGNLVMDANLAAIALQHGLTICTADADFARFPNVSWLNPIA
jgi:toxin-antitoxin system PIN domain toxin